MNNPLIKLCLIALLMVGTMTQVSAQNGVSAADKKAIVDIFKGVDASKYRLVFNNGSEVYGSKAIKMADLKTLSRTGGTAAKGTKWTFIAGDRSANEVFYIYSEGESELMSLLGKQKMKALEDISAKYNDLR
ncbi:hypothetical protein [Haliscomenobacter sp.]|uniref:hypothetical protein n=1 Tax=Haliscomenobacter sp. TaxID=2717303 RepID=UPI003BA8879E